MGLVQNRVSPDAAARKPDTAQVFRADAGERAKDVQGGQVVMCHHPGHGGAKEGGSFRNGLFMRRGGCGGRGTIESCFAGKGVGNRTPYFSSVG